MVCGGEGCKAGRRAKVMRNMATYTHFHQHYLILNISKYYYISVSSRYQS